ncbi:MAG: hypothetical protein V1887_02745 [Candidatus Aenigmatarchaeota archaeon]
MSMIPQTVPSVVNTVDTKFSALEERVKRTLECERELMEFEILASLNVKPQAKIHETMKEERAKAWKEAMKRAGNNEEKAVEIFDEIYLK